MNEILYKQKMKSRAPDDDDEEFKEWESGYLADTRARNLLRILGEQDYTSVPFYGEVKNLMRQWDEDKSPSNSPARAIHTQKISNLFWPNAQGQHLFDYQVPILREHPSGAAWAATYFSDLKSPADLDFDDEEADRVAARIRGAR
jgi:hypothetical protein